MKWVRRYHVRGSHGDEYIVGLSDENTWGCSCPRWKFAKAPKAECKHITATRHGLLHKGVDLHQDHSAPAASRFAVLDLDAVKIGKAIPVATRFAHLDYEIEVMA